MRCTVCGAKVPDDPIYTRTRGQVGLCDECAADLVDSLPPPEPTCEGCSQFTGLECLLGGRLQAGCQGHHVTSDGSP